MAENPIEQAAETVLYEWDMFNLAFRKCKEAENSSQENINFALECFLLHARVLYDFLKNEPIKDDISAQHSILMM